MSIHARPSLNGNTVEDFTAAFYALGEAEKAVQAALVVLQTNVLHGRNYQHLADAKRERFVDDRKVEPIRAGLQAIVDIKLDIVAAIQPERK